MSRIAIIGGGVAGLACALALRDRGHAVTVLEREAAAGGKVATAHVASAVATSPGPWQVELGPAGVLDNAPATAALYARLGIAGEVLRADEGARHRFIVRGGVLRELPGSPPAIVTSSALPLGAKLRLVGELMAAAAPAGVDETIADFARRRLGGEIAAGLVEPMVTGVFAGDYERLSMRSAFPRLVEMERQHGSLLRALMAAERERKANGAARGGATLTTLRGGMGRLPAALSAALGADLRTGAAVVALERAGEGGWRVRLADGALPADVVVLALPPDDAARLMQPLDAALVDAFSAIPVGAIAAVTLGYARAEIAHRLAGFGFLVPRREEGVPILGSIWMTSTFPDAGQAPDGQVMLRCMLGGARDPAAVSLPDAQLIARSREALARLLGVAAEPSFTHVVRWPRGIPQYEVGHAGRVATIEERGAAMGLHATGSSLRGVGVNDVIREADALAERIGGS